MKKYIHQLTFLGLLLFGMLSSSCFDILEEYLIHDDGSGTLKVTIDMQEMGALMQSLGQESEGEEGSPLGELDDMFNNEEMTMALRQLDGVHNVENLSDADNYIMAYKFDFDELAIVNDFMNDGNSMMDALSMTVGDGESASDDNSTPRSFAMKGKKFTTKGAVEMGEAEGEEDQMYREMAMTMMNDAHYKVVYKFDREVKKVKKNDNVIIGADGKSVILDVTMADLLNGKSDFASQVKLK